MVLWIFIYSHFGASWQHIVRVSPSPHYISKNHAISNCIKTEKKTNYNQHLYLGLIFVGRSAYYAWNWNLYNNVSTNSWNFEYPFNSRFNSLCNFINERLFGQIISKVTSTFSFNFFRISKFEPFTFLGWWNKIVRQLTRTALSTQFVCWHHISKSWIWPCLH